MDAEPNARRRKASLESIVQRYVSDLKAARLEVALDPSLSEEDRARQLRRLCGDREDMRKARRVLFRHLPSETPNTRAQVQAAQLRLFDRHQRAWPTTRYLWFRHFLKGVYL